MTTSDTAIRLNAHFMQMSGKQLQYLHTTQFRALDSQKIPKTQFCIKIYTYSPYKYITAGNSPGQFCILYFLFWKKKEILGYIFRQLGAHVVWEDSHAVNKESFLQISCYFFTFFIFNLNPLNKIVFIIKKIKIWNSLCHLN